MHPQPLDDTMTPQCDPNSMCLATIARIEGKLDTVLEDHNTLVTDSARHNAALFGNGKPGLMTRVDRIEMLGTWSGWMVKALWTGCAGLSGLVGGWALTHYLH